MNRQSEALDNQQKESENEQFVQKQIKKNPTVLRGLQEGLKKVGVKGNALSDRSANDIRKEIENFNQTKSIVNIILKAGIPIPNKVDIDLEDEWGAVKNKYNGLSNIPSPLLGEYLDKFSTILGYAYYCQAIADYESMSLKTQKEFAKEKLFLIQPTMSNKDTQVALVHNEPLYCELTEKYLIEYGKWRIITALVNSYERKTEAISREITRRGNEINFDNRSHNISNM